MNIAFKTAALVSLVSVAHAAPLTPIADRESRVLLNETRRMSAPMSPSHGSTPAELDRRPIACDLPAASATIPAGVPRAPGSTALDLEGMARFLQLGLTQSHDKTYSEGWSILDTNIRKALTCLSHAPRGITLALETARAACAGRAFDDAYAILRETMVTLSRSAVDFASDRSSIHLLALARRCSYEKSYETGWLVLQKFASAVKSTVPSTAWQVALGAALNAGSGRTFDTAYDVLHTTFRHLEHAGDAHFDRFYFAMALECSANKTHEESWTILERFTRHALENHQVDGFRKLTLETALETARGKTFDTAYAILRDAVASLR